MQKSYKDKWEIRVWSGELVGLLSWTGLRTEGMKADYEEEYLGSFADSLHGLIFAHASMFSPRKAGNVSFSRREIHA
jgi:hypothetical protein